MNRLGNTGGGVPSKGFRLDKADGKLMGVCSGLAEWSGIDPLAWRLLFVVGTLAGFGLMIPVYIAIGLLAD